MDTMDRLVHMIEDESQRSKEVIDLMRAESERQEKTDREFLSMMRCLIDSNNNNIRLQQQQQQQHQHQQRQNMMMGMFPWQGNNEC